MKAIERRLLDLEQHQPGGFEVVWGYDQETYEELPESEIDRLVAEAELRAGPRGVVLRVVYDHNWSPDEAAA